MALRSNWRANKEEVVAHNGVVTAMQPPSAPRNNSVLNELAGAMEASRNEDQAKLDQTRKICASVDNCSGG